MGSRNFSLRNSKEAIDSTSRFFQNNIVGRPVRGAQVLSNTNVFEGSGPPLKLYLMSVHRL